MSLSAAARANTRRESLKKRACVFAAARARSHDSRRIKLHDGEIWMTNQDLFGFPNSIMRLTDVDSDGKYNSVGETHIWTDEFVDKARAMDVYGSD